MISISAASFDIKGNVTFSELPESTFPFIKRRVTRTATLDGNNVITDMGLAESDGVFIIKSDDITVINSIEYLMRNYSVVIFSCRLGIFSGVIKTLQNRKTPYEFTFMADKKLN